MKIRSLFREVNERIREVNGRFAVDDSRGNIDVFCECGDAGCLKRLEVPPAIYEQVRDEEDFFLVTPGHEHGEPAVAQGKTYRIVLLQGRVPEFLNEAS